MDAKERKNEWEVECCLKIQAGLAALKTAIRDGTYLHPKDISFETATTEQERETIFLKHFKREMKDYFRRINKNDFDSLDGLSDPKSSLLLGKHGKNISACVDALKALQDLVSHNLVGNTTLTDGTEIQGNLSLSIDILKKHRFSINADQFIVVNATCNSAISFNPDKETRYTTWYHHCLSSAASEEKRRRYSNTEYQFDPLTEAGMTAHSESKDQSIVEVKKAHQTILELIEKLHDSDRYSKLQFERLIMHFVTGKTYQAIADEQDVERQAVQQSVERALVNLRKAAEERGLNLKKLMGHD